MSVVKAERKEGKLEVLNCVWELCVYTLQACKSEKKFPKRDRWILAKPIADEALNALKCIRMANSIYVTCEAEFEFRHMNQVEAYGHLESMLSLIELAYKTFGIESHSIEHWVGLVVDTENKLKSWTKSDKERYKKGDSAQ